MDDVTNPEMAAAWDGPDGARWVENEEQHDLALARHTARMFASAEIEPHEHVLDIGCGCGQTTRAAARSAARGSALGVDLSSRMLERARERAEEAGLTNVTFVQCDAQAYPFPPDAFDVVISRQGAMFFADPVAAFSNIGRGLRPGARLALLAWQVLDRNEWMLALRCALLLGREIPERPPGIPGPFGLAEEGHVRAVLDRAGYERVGLEDVDEPFVLGRDVEHAWDFAQGIGVVRGLLADLGPKDRERALAQLRATIETHDTGNGVVFDSRAWLITATRPHDTPAR
jgi:SAM-dependent methyltransferase